MKFRQKHFWFDEPQEPMPWDREIFVDLFAGGGGASEGYRLATGREPDAAVNHDKSAIAMHAANHPTTHHWCENLWDVDPEDVTEGRRVGGAWFSPDCTHFSKAKGSKPREKRIRGLAWLVIRWAARTRQRVIFVENVEEFVTWGPLKKGQPDPKRKGHTFEQWKAKLQELGYKVEYRVLCAADFGSPTTRKRLFVIARCDGQKIIWPKPTHGSRREIVKRLETQGACNLQPWRSAAEIIDWSLPCPSIFDSSEEIMRKFGIRAVRPLAEKTLKRIAEGVRRYVVETSDPFIVVTNHGGTHFRGQSIERPLSTVTQKHGYGLVTPTLVQTGYGERPGQKPRCLDLQEPLGTVVAGGGKHAVVAPALVSYYGPKGENGHRGRLIDDPLPTQTTENRFGLVSAFIAKHFGGQVGINARQPLPTTTMRGTQNQLVAATLIKNNHGQKQWFDIRDPLRTVVAQGTHHAEVRAFLFKYYGSGGQWNDITEPAPTITVKDRLALGLVLVGGELFQIVDIGMRMLTPRELFNAQGFRSDYKIDIGLNGKPATKTEQVGRCGNSVCPQLAETLVRANYQVKKIRQKEAVA